MGGIRSLFIAAAAVLWSADALFRKPLTQNLPALAIVFAEHLLALVFVVPLLIRFRAGIRLITAKQWAALGFVGIGASALATVAFTASFSYVSPSVAILLQKLQPLFTFILALPLLGERLPRNFWKWAGVALVGAYLISFPNFVPDIAIYHGGLTGVLLAVAAAALWGSATVFGRYLLHGVPFPLVTALRFLIALPFLGVLLALSSGFGAFNSLNGRDIIFLIIIMLGPGFGAMYLYYRGLEVTKASLSALLELVWPLSAVVLNWVFLHDSLTLVQFAGGLALLGAIARLTIWSKPAQQNI